MASSISNVGSISSAGIGSGLDVESIVTKLMALEQQPLKQLQSQATDLNTTLSSYGKLQSYYSALRDKANAITDPTLWSATTATAADTSAMKVATGTSAATGNYAVNIDHLASGQNVIAATALPTAASTLNAGTLTIELGTYVTTPTAGLQAKSGTTPVTVTIGAGDTSLSAIRDKINAANAGVTASIVTDASGARLSLRSNDTGAENAFRITATETTDDGNAATGLSSLAFDASGVGPSQMSPAQTARNAAATINGIPVSSASNTLTNAIDGLTINLLKPTGGDVNVVVANDTAAVKQKITDFVGAFNDLAGYLRTQMAYDETAKKGGPLQGDQSAVAMQSQLRAMLNLGSTASSTWSRMSDIGIAMKTDGTLDTNSTKLDNALGNLTELKKLLSTDATTTAAQGFVRRWKNLADTALGSKGVFDTRTSGIKDTLSRNGKSQDAMQQRLSATETRLRAQYNALDAKMANLNGLSSYMTQQIKSLTSSSN